MNCDVFDLNKIWQPVVDWTIGSSFYQSFGLLVVFLYAMTPSIIAIPNESFWVPLYDKTPENLKSDLLSQIWILTTVGGFLGDSLIYFASKHGVKYFIKEEKLADKKMKKWVQRMHTHRYWIFILSPSAFGIGDAALIFAGIHKYKYGHFALYLFIGNALRNTWGIAAVVTGFSIWNWFC